MIKYIVQASPKNHSTIVINKETGLLTYLGDIKEKPLSEKETPVNFFLINPNKINNIERGEYFFLTDTYDDIYICTDVKNNSVSGKKIINEETECTYQEPAFEHIPLNNVRRIVKMVNPEGFLNIKPLTKDKKIISNVIRAYNENKL